MTDELKPCPFCGGEYGGEEQIEYNSYTHSCADCPTFPTEEAAREAWNHRPVEDALRARVKALEEALKFYSNDKNYILQLITEECGCCSYYEDETKANEDSGKIAKTALEGE